MENNQDKLVWMITADNTANSQAGTWGMVGQGCSVWLNGVSMSRTHNDLADCPISQAELTLNGHKFRLTNDDGGVDYEGIMTHELADSPDILAPLDDFAMPNVGSTTLQLWSNVSQKWESVN